MGKRLTANEETTLLLRVIREAHEATQALNQAIRDATALEPKLVAEFEKIANREIRRLSNHLQAAMNQASAELNTAVAEARGEIIRQLTLAEIIYDRDSGSLKVVFQGGTFDTRMPLPYSHQPAKDPMP